MCQKCVNHIFLNTGFYLCNLQYTERRIHMTKRTNERLHFAAPKPQIADIVCIHVKSKVCTYTMLYMYNLEANRCSYNVNVNSINNLPDLKSRTRKRVRLE